MFLSPFDSWAGTIFALRDAGIDSDGAAIISTDTSCTAPLFSEDLTSLGGTPYIAFRDSAFLNPDDGGPYTIDRTREGYIEVYAMADVAAPLSTAIVHGSNGATPTGCAQVRSLDPGNVALSTPTGGLMGSVSIINVAQGTYLSARAEALAGFTGSNLFTGPENVLPNLSSVNDGIGFLAVQATARIIDASGNMPALTFPGPDSRSRRLDAVSAVFMADHVFNEYQKSPSLGASSDWLLTMPTKPFYTDPLYTVATSGGQAIPPFVAAYDGSSVPVNPNPLAVSRQYSPVQLGVVQYDRNVRSPEPCCLFPGQTYPPPVAPFVTNVLSFYSSATAIPVESSVMASRLLAPFRRVFADAGWLDLSLDAATVEPHATMNSTNGTVLCGLPVIGFWASNIVNNNVSNGVLANYAAAVRHATSVTCRRAGQACD